MQMRTHLVLGAQSLDELDVFLLGAGLVQDAKMGGAAIQSLGGLTETASKTVVDLKDSNRGLERVEEYLRRKLKGAPKPSSRLPVDPRSQTTASASSNITRTHLKSILNAHLAFGSGSGLCLDLIDLHLLGSLLGVAHDVRVGVVM